MLHCMQQFFFFLPKKLIKWGVFTTRENVSRCNKYKYKWQKKIILTILTIHKLLKISIIAFIFFVNIPLHDCNSMEKQLTQFNRETAQAKNLTRFEEKKRERRKNCYLRCNLHNSVKNQFYFFISNTKIIVSWITILSQCASNAFSHVEKKSWAPFHC